jgi:adenylosuccinate lyase
MQTDALDALSPVDGRYRAAADSLRPALSESALIRERLQVEALWLLCLNRHRAQLPQLLELRAGLPPAVLAAAEQIAAAPPADAAREIKEIEARINHDVKAVEYWLRDRLASAGASPALLELVHFGCTSEDINNLAYARMLQAARVSLQGTLDTIAAPLQQNAARYATLPMLARTHGQPASPTTLGKEFANVAARLVRVRQRWQRVAALGKFNGAVGNFNAHVIAAPDADWPAIGRTFVESQGLEWNSQTTQIEPHDWIAEYCDAVAAINVVLLDFARDCWGYISLGYLRQRAVAGEVGSSTMPHKVNPIDFENGEGNLGIANALLRHFAEKLPVSRWQRDLTDSTVLRTLGVALAHSLIGWKSIARGLAKIEPDAARMSSELDDAWEVLGEAVQTVLRANGVPEGYEKLKVFSRGRSIDADTLRQFIGSLPLPAEQRERLSRLQPRDYVGLAAVLASPDSDSRKPK